jgi:ferredoxin
MFARAFLEPGTERFEEYYRMRPRNRAPDDAFRREPGLLDPGSALFHPLAFPAADAAFWTIEMLRPFVDGEVAASRSGLDPATVTRFLKRWTLELGAHSVGVTALKDYHLYTHVGRGQEYGRPVESDHTRALALTVEMDKEMVDRAPHGPTAMESAHQYLRCGAMAVQLADLLRRLGYGARAHVDGNYRVICPLVARDAGLGEIGRMGLLMTPRLGPRCRIAVVTTDFPLVFDVPERDLTVVDFCRRCRKCAEACPSRALPFGDAEEADGVRRWKIDADACFMLWCRLGTDCARCMAVCPYSHPGNALHNAVRWGIRNNPFFRSVAVRLDDLVYGRRPPPKALQAWLTLSDGAEPPRSGTALETEVE